MVYSVLSITYGLVSIALGVLIIIASMLTQEGTTIIKFICPLH